MREKELRLAVVLTGGVSLAVYMHGVSRELLKLVRASKVYHSEADFAERKKASYRSLNDDPARETDTEEIYFEFLQSLASETELRVVLDVISGASAGGVNGVMLARALAHDLPLDTHRAMWLEHADVLELMDEQTLAGRWSKIYLTPLLWMMYRGYLRSLAPDQETRDKLFTFIRSRWFEPPFSGKRYINWMLDAAHKMQNGRTGRGSLLPEGHQLDLFVNITDFHGHNSIVEMHDPPEAIETEHRMRLHFRYVQEPGGEKYSDFDQSMIPSLIFAARATSSFPGAFPPATFSEMDEVLKNRHESWSHRKTFIESQFRGLIQSGRRVEHASFIDGSTINNKPFAAAIVALSARPAHREVVRRLIYVDPNPDAGEGALTFEAPNIFRNILGALLEIPRNEPVRDELTRLATTNRTVRMMRDVVELARPHVDDQVDKIISSHETAPSVQDLAKWRTKANTMAADSSGVAFESYFRLKILRVLSRLENLLCAFLDRKGIFKKRQIVQKALHQWSEEKLSSMQSHGKTEQRADIVFLVNFDVDFRVRRLRFVIQRLNQLYRMAPDGETVNRFSDLDDVKTTIYESLNQVRRNWDDDHYPDQLVTFAQDVFGHEPDMNKLDQLLCLVRDHMGLHIHDAHVDEIFSIMGLNYMGPVARKEVYSAYIGFSFFDVLTFTMLQEEDLNELDEVLIHRISPKDASSLYENGKPPVLQGLALRAFGGFFNRKYREHDYLLGRLSAADRLVDLLMDAEQSAIVKTGLDIAAIKKKLFVKILDAEERFLNHDPELVAGLRRRFV